MAFPTLKDPPSSMVKDHTFPPVFFATLKQDLLGQGANKGPTFI